MSLNVTSNIGVIRNSNSNPDKAFNLSQPENASTTEFTDKVILDSIVHHNFSPARKPHRATAVI